MDKLLSVQEAGERLGVSLWTVYRLARCGQLVSVRIGRRRLFAERDLEELVRQTRAKPSADESEPNEVRRELARAWRGNAALKT